MGAVATAIKLRKIGPKDVRHAVGIMATLNRDASEAMVDLGATGATDITGFGFLGHASELAEASGVTLRVDPARIPVLPCALELARKECISGGAWRNREYAEPRSSVADDIADDMEPALLDLLFDSETSGGLLIALRPAAAEKLVRRLRRKGHAYAAIIGRVVRRSRRFVELAPGG
jgi:selenide,water dikinase